MTFVDALMQFRVELYKEYGINEGIVKIGIEPELYDRVMRKMWDEHRVVGPSDWTNVRVCDIAIVPKRKKDEF